MKKKIVSKLHLSKETLRNMADHDLQKAAGGTTMGNTECSACSYSQKEGSCDTFQLCC